jgi:signal transduction histidine kinase
MRAIAPLAAYGQRLAAWGRGVPQSLVDMVIALACSLTVVTHALINDRVTWYVTALGLANTLPLLCRRRYPLLVMCVCGWSTGALAVLDAIDIPAAQLVSTYTVAALAAPAHRLIGAAGTAVGVVGSIVASDDELVTLGPNAVLFAVAYAMGNGVRARRTQIAMLEERAGRLAEEQAAAATRERERIAREMHDIIAHAMSLVVVQAEAGPVAVQRDPDRAEEVFDTISVTAREALAQLRRTLQVLRADQQELHPQPGLDGLPPLVERVRQAGLTAWLEERGEPRPVPADLAATVYRIVQESLTNTVRHAAAETVSVRLEWRGSTLGLEVRDDGKGHGEDRGKAEPGGRGLAGMRERVAAAGGELTFGSGPDGSGFRVAASLPLTADR